jgi:hypothetical protein
METTRLRSFSENPARNYKGAITLMPVRRGSDSGFARVQVTAIQTTSIVANNSGRPRRPRARFPAARVAEGVLGPFFDCEVFRTLKRPATKSDDSCHSSCR